MSRKTAFLFLFLFLGPIIFGSFLVKTDSIDLNGLKRMDPGWEVYDESQGTDGFIKLHSSKWLMYFLHWRPLTEKNKDISLEYVRHHLLNFWGENMDFELTGQEGEIEICGHKGFYTQGTIYNGAVRTRFIVWNCPETSRQFTADCNINVRKGTRQEFLDLQEEITAAVSCHQSHKKDLDERLTSVYHSPEWSISFFKPSNWKTKPFLYKEWYPDGITKHRGSLWTLLTDSEKHIELHWKQSEDKVSETLFRQFLEEITQSESISEGSVQSRITEFRLNEIRKQQNGIRGEGTYTFRMTREDQTSEQSYRFAGCLYRENNKMVFLLASLVQLKGFWGMENDLSASGKVWNLFIEEEVLPNTKWR
ncbi:MAG: hypothetical protein GF421_10750 [Candidatus Aminicenantes bacterium]|nr:hypothetical protein [Candidatus Aminicenantes bacterium]